MEFAAYDYEMKHTICPGNATLSGACVMYETMRSIMKEDMHSLKTTEESTGKSTTCIFQTLHGGLLLGCCGEDPTLDEQLDCLARTIEMRYGCYKCLKPTDLPQLNDPEQQNKAPLNSPEFLSAIHSIAAHINICSSLLGIKEHEHNKLFTPLVPCRNPPVSAFTQAIRFATQRMIKKDLLGFAIYTNRK